jgi:Leucine-rich repeat (LRR) protein
LGNSALGKSSSLIFPTGYDSGITDDRDKVNAKSTNSKAYQINVRLDQCEAVRFRFKKKLLLDKLNLTCSDVPVKDLCGTALGNSLYMLSLAGNRLGAVPPQLVVSLPALRKLDLSQCELHTLPPQFNLPKLAQLNLSNNRFTEFPDEVCVCSNSF